MVGLNGWICSRRARDSAVVGGVIHSVRAVQYGLPQSSQNFYGVLEHYNPLTGTFFTPVGEMGLALHELYDVSGLLIVDT